jgi:Na+/H+ antiporter NhaC
MFVGGTGIYISSALEDSVDSGAYPALTFVISGILALVTGSSWGTMSIMSVPPYPDLSLYLFP